ncbi:MAG: adenylosuccinate lyase [Gammaproteobacteria bacterium]|nr:adenylosuccinate lyase [Gammaproteobacteria bacterium]
MSGSPSDCLPALEALSPVDGRYREATGPLRGLMSEAGLIRERIRIEALWLLHLAASVPQLAGSKLSPAVAARARQLGRAPEDAAPLAVKGIEARINHDVKAVEYYIREQLAAAGASAATLELVHFGCTSEDINNLSYACLLRSARTALLPVLAGRAAELTQLAHRYADTAMPARTHGQPASPTTLGKELANFAARLGRAQQRWAAVGILGKWNGAVGNFNAHVAALPAVDWPAIARAFVGSLGLEYNAWTTQIEPHDWIGEYCDAAAAANVICIDLCRDLWGYVSLGYLRQRAVSGEVGSSTMPHKVNPIDFENAEGNCGVANALLRHFAEKLPVSRWQRDLTDSTVLRNLGVALGHSLIAWQALGRGLQKIEADPAHMRADLEGSWELLAEAVQTVLRAAGIPDGYERLKEFSRGRAIDAAALATFIEGLPLPQAEKDRLRSLRPEAYTGLAAQLARQV